MLFLFCSDTTFDPVAPSIFKKALQLYQSSEKEHAWHASFQGHELIFLESTAFPSMIYPSIAPQLNTQFPDVDFIGLINWHEGGNAPNKIFCVHSTADVPSGTFAPSSGKILSAIIKAIESEREGFNLSDFKPLYEASHWSGIVYGRPFHELTMIKAPVFDIEIGSSAEDWQNETAQDILVHALGKIPEWLQPDRPQALYLGGTHFEPSTTQIVMEGVDIAHQMPNHWLQSGEYNNPGSEAKIIACAQSCLQPVDFLIYNAGLKSAYKDNIRKAADYLGIPTISHKQMRIPNWKDTIEWTMKT
jgi:D-tyrosyl-tRNA(Tyr) deacylase